VTLVAVFPRHLLGHEGHRDLVALTYERLQLFRRPGDRQLRLALVDDELALGDLPVAAHTLAPLEQGAVFPEDVEAREIQLQLRVWRALDGSSPERATAQEALARRLQVDAERPFPPEVQVDLAFAALELRRPDLAAGLFGRLAVSAVTPRAPAAEQACAKLAGSPPPGALCFAALAFTSALQSNGTFDAVALAEKIVQRFPDERDILLQATSVASSQAEAGAAVSWWRQVVAKDPEDASALSQLLSLELASGQIVSATDTAAALLQLQPSNKVLRQRAARLALWADQPGRAVEFWRPVAEAGEPEAVRSVLEITRSLGQHDASWTLLERVSKVRQLSPDEWDDLFVEARLGLPPSQAAAVLERVLRRRGGDRAHWAQLIELELQAGHVYQAVATRASIASRWRRRDEEILRDAELLWRAGQTDRALQVIRQATGAHATRLAGELALQLGADGVARSSYEALLKEGTISADELERLILLRQESGESESATTLAAAALKDHPEPRFLWITLNALVAARNWHAVRVVMADARKRGLAPIGSVQWASLTTELDVSEGRWTEAEAAAREAFRLAPESRTLRARLLWLADKVQDVAVLQPLLDDGFAAAGDQSLWPLYAAGYDHLGRVPESLIWYERIARANPHDSAAVLAWADALARSNHADAAHRLQAWVYGQIFTQPATGPELNIPLTVSRASLALGFSGPVVGRAIARQLAAREEPGARRAAVEWLLSAGEVDEARIIAAGAPASEKQDWPAADCLALTEGSTSGESCVGKLAEVLPSDPHASGRLPPELALDADASLSSAAGYGLFQAVASGGWKSGDLRADLSAGAEDLWRPVGPHQQGLEVALQGAATSAAGRTIVRAGIDWRPNSPLPQVSVDHHVVAATGLTIGSSVLVNDLAGEWGPLRADAARDWAGAEAQFAPARSMSLLLQAGWQRFATRGGGPLSDGAAMNLEFQDAPLPALPLLRLRATVTGQLNALNDRNAEHFVDGPASLWIPTRLLETGAGASWSSGDLDDRRRRWSLLADVWAGWIWPYDRAAFRFSGGAGFRLGHEGLLFLNGFVASDEPFLQSGIVGGFQLQYRQEPKS
jgi:predicted Zn-dependent protease